MRVKDIMSRNVKTCKLDDTIEKCAKEMVKNGVSMLVVVSDDELTTLGVITKSDIATRVVAEGKDPKKTTVREVYSAPIRTIYENASVELLADKLHSRNLRNRVVLNEKDELVGICGTTDLLRMVAEGKYK